MILGRKLLAACALLLSTAPLPAQNSHLWVLRAPGEMIEYDPTTFAAKQKVKVPADAVNSPASVSMNHMGQILIVPTVSLPLSQQDLAAGHKIWLWDGHAASTIDQGIEQKVEKTGSNDAITESAPAVYLSADGTHLFWFANRARRLQREGVDLSLGITWQAWQTDLAGAGRVEIASSKLPDCRCPTGSCEESCPTASVWVPENGVDGFFVLLQSFTGQTGTVYKASTRYQLEGGKWKADALTEPLQRVLDADPSGNAIVEAIPDTGCCGWSNQSNDRTLVLADEKKIPVFDEQATYNNPDYDVSFYTPNARLSPKLGYVAMTVETTAQLNEPIQLAEQGEANPEESQRIRKAVADLPAVVVKKMAETPSQVAFVPHAALVGWINEKEILIVENKLLVAYDVDTGTRRKSTVKVSDATHVFLR